MIYRFRLTTVLDIVNWLKFLQIECGLHACVQYRIRDDLYVLNYFGLCAELQVEIHSYSCLHEVTFLFGHFYPDQSVIPNFTWKSSILRFHWFLFSLPNLLTIRLPLVVSQAFHILQGMKNENFSSQLDWSLFPS